MRSCGGHSVYEHAGCRISGYCGWSTRSVTRRGDLKLRSQLLIGPGSLRRMDELTCECSNDLNYLNKSAAVCQNKAEVYRPPNLVAQARLLGPEQGSRHLCSIHAGLPLATPIKTT